MLWDLKYEIVGIFLWVYCSLSALSTVEIDAEEWMAVIKEGGRHVPGGRASAHCTAGQGLQEGRGAAQLWVLPQVRECVCVCVCVLKNEVTAGMAKCSLLEKGSSLPVKASPSSWTCWNVGILWRFQRIDIFEFSNSL